MFIGTFFLFSTCVAELEKPEEKAPPEEKKIIINPKKEIVFGQSGIFSGSLSLYGNIIKTGIVTYFKQVNELGGVNGKKLRLISWRIIS